MARKTRVLVTGFSGGWPSSTGRLVKENVSQLVCQRLAVQWAKSRGGVDLRTVVTPVSWRDSAASVLPVLQEHEPDIVLNLGHHPLALGLQVERRMFNFMAHPDVLGDDPGMKFIAEGKPLAYETSTPADFLISFITTTTRGRVPIYMHDIPVPARWDDVGEVHRMVGCPAGLDYICNYSGYIAANWLNENGKKNAMQLLMHLPSPANVPFQTTYAGVKMLLNMLIKFRKCGAEVAFRPALQSLRAMMLDASIFGP